MLSAEELFRFRAGYDQAMPSRGGEKEFMPDGSWLQDKHIENFLQEQERVISEPTIVRGYDLVKGEWNPDKGLLELSEKMIHRSDQHIKVQCMTSIFPSKVGRNFWEYMGFIDDKRKWLFPEEALFLVETGILEMWYEGLPLSIQEAYAALIGKKIQLEFYQVYAHLRRIGYVVLRHQGRYAFTRYERQIGLDKYQQPKKKRKTDKTVDKSACVAESETGDQSIDFDRGDTGDQSDNSEQALNQNDKKISRAHESSETDKVKVIKDTANECATSELDIEEMKTESENHVAEGVTAEESIDFCREEFGDQSNNLELAQNQENEEINMASKSSESERIIESKDITNECATSEMDIEEMKTESEDHIEGAIGDQSIDCVGGESGDQSKNSELSQSQDNKEINRASNSSETDKVKVTKDTTNEYAASEIDIVEMKTESEVDVLEDGLTGDQSTDFGRGESRDQSNDSELSQSQNDIKMNRASKSSEIDMVKVSKDTTSDCATSEMDSEEMNTESEWNSNDTEALDKTVVQMDENQRSPISEDKTNKTNQSKISEWNFDEILFPNFKSSQETVLVCKPNVDYIPQGHETCFREEEYSFEKMKYINTKKQKKKQHILDEETFRQLDFSHQEIMTGWHKVKKSCRNWKEYKVAVEKEKASWDRTAELPYLYGNELEPLVKPELARSTCAVLEQLKVIEEDVPPVITTKPEVLPDFDVYTPNTKYKKSKPGLPDFRVKVLRPCDPVPGLQIVNSISSYLDDEASLKWAVVECGNIAFYSMSDLVLPQDISLG